MKMLSGDMAAYLMSTRYIDWAHASILEKAAEIRARFSDKTEYARAPYEFVRDGIRHSWDARDSRVTVSASDVLREGVGICWAKANLLAALLRANGIPSGICYQRLTLGSTPDGGYCIHALNAVYLGDEHGWIRLDARGNKPGIDAQFSLAGERLAFPVRAECGEEDYLEIHAEPAAITMRVLERNADALHMYQNDLPDAL